MLCYCLFTIKQAQKKNLGKTLESLMLTDIFQARRQRTSAWLSDLLNKNVFQNIRNALRGFFSFFFSADRMWKFQLEHYIIMK